MLLGGTLLRPHSWLQHVATPQALFVISSVYAGLLFFVFVFDLVFIEKLRQSQVVGVDRVAGETRKAKTRLQCR